MELIDQFAELVPELSKLGVIHIIAEYNGGGDEGFCEHANYYATNGLMVDVPDKLDEKLRELAFEASTVHAGGWWNDEGGFGEVVFDVPGRSIRVKHNDYIENTEYSEAYYS